MLTFVIILILLIAAYVFVLIRPLTRDFDEFLLRSYAHRGLHGGDTPENSLAAFEKAVDAGYGIELDLQLSRDGEVMVFHDYSLERMTGTPKKLCELTKAELEQLSLSGTGEKIPTLGEVLALVGGKVPLLIELKGESTDVSLCPKADEILKKYSGAYLIESFNPILLRWYRLNRPNVHRGLLVTDICREKGFNPLNLALSSMLLNVLCRPDFISYDIKSRKFLPILLCKALYNVKRFIWTIRGRDELKTSEEERAIPIFERNIMG